jgi:YgiT-type zinc finger domain-containing protein
MIRRSFMYSSHQKNRLIKLPKKLECPSCGRVSMVIKKGATKMADDFSVHNISRWVCTNCGEELFNPQAMSEIGRQRSLKSQKAVG